MLLRNKCVTCFLPTKCLQQPTSNSCCAQLLMEPAFKSGGGGVYTTCSSCTFLCWWRICTLDNDLTNKLHLLFLHLLNLSFVTELILQNSFFSQNTTKNITNYMSIQGNIRVNDLTIWYFQYSGERNFYLS